MEEFLAQLGALGVTPQTVDPATRRGGDTPGYGSKWKTYYVSRDFPQWGVLLGYAEDGVSLDDRVAQLEEEVANYGLLSAAGHEVPRVAPTALILTDALSVRSAAALVIEHIDGPGPYKASTQARTVMRIANERGGASALEAKASWAQLRTAVHRRVPMDLQVKMSASGRIVVIDPEKTRTGDPIPLPEWDEDLGL